MRVALFVFVFSLLLIPASVPAQPERFCAPDACVSAHNLLEKELGDRWDGCYAEIGKELRSERAEDDPLVWIAHAYEKGTSEPRYELGFDAYTREFTGYAPEHRFASCPDYPNKCPQPPEGCAASASTE